jgi:hypothetical protein
MAPPFLTLALDGSYWSNSRPYGFTLGEIALGNQWTGGWVGPRHGLDYTKKKKYTAPTESGTLAVQSMA